MARPLRRPRRPRVLARRARPDGDPLADSQLLGLRGRGDDRRRDAPRDRNERRRQLRRLARPIGDRVRGNQPARLQVARPDQADQPGAPVQPRRRGAVPRARAGGPTMLITDQAAYSDQVFGLYWLLGYQFSPRPAGLRDQRFWYFTRDSDYGALHGLARNRINPKLIHAHWDDILRVIASLSTGTVRASELLGVLQGVAAQRRWAARSPSPDATPRRCTSCTTSTATPTGAASACTSTATKAATPLPASSSTATAESYASPTAKAKKTSSPRSDSRSTSSIHGRRDQPPPPQRPRDQRRAPRTALTAAARAHPDARHVPLHAPARARRRPTPSTANRRTPSSALTSTNTTCHPDSPDPTHRSARRARVRDPQCARCIRTRRISRRYARERGRARRTETGFAMVGSSSAIVDRRAGSSPRDTNVTPRAPRGTRPFYLTGRTDTPYCLICDTSGMTSTEGYGAHATRGHHVR